MLRKLGILKKFCKKFVINVMKVHKILLDCFTAKFVETVKEFRKFPNLKFGKFFLLFFQAGLQLPKF